MNPVRRFICTVAAAMLAMSFPAISYSQEYVGTPVSISKEKVKVDGKIFYSHIVMEKQTLYSISKAYGVEVEDLYRHNPSLKENGLKKNAILLIPVVDSPAPVREKEDSIVVQPEPEPQQAPAPRQDKGKAKKKKIHTVKWYEDLDMISEKYGISVESIMRANNLTGRKLTARQKLEIPAEEIPADSLAVAVIPEEIPQVEQDEEETAEQDNGQRPWYLFRKNRTDVSLILPLKADGVSGSRNNMDFYSGVLLAARDLALKGMDVNIEVYDAGDGTLPEWNKLKGSDMIIGPVSSGDLSRMLEEVPGTCPVISPLDQRAETLAGCNWNMIQAPTPHQVLYDNLAGWLKGECTDADRVVFVTEKNTRDTATATMMKSAVDSTGLSYETFSYSILEGRDVLEPLTLRLTDTGVNRFVVASESEAFVNDVVRNLNILIHNKYNVVLYAPAKIRTYETMEVENLHNTNLHACLGYGVDYDNPQVRDFLLKYRALFNTEPSQYAFQGYDIACYCIEMYFRFGPQWQEKLDQNDRQMLQSNFMFRRTDDNGGWVNKGVKRIVYEKNWSVRQY
ncbi:MAG: LysM peptidoglycan-binding domain-containing protein [Candidatus Cryptobacteroides sp.]